MRRSSAPEPQENIAARRTSVSRVVSRAHKRYRRRRDEACLSRSERAVCCKPRAVKRTSRRHVPQSKPRSPHGPTRPHSRPELTAVMLTAWSSIAERNPRLPVAVRSKTNSAPRPKRRRRPRARPGTAAPRPSASVGLSGSAPRSASLSPRQKYGSIKCVFRLAGRERRVPRHSDREAGLVTNPSANGVLLRARRSAGGAPPRGSLRARSPSPASDRRTGRRRRRT